MTTSSLRLFRAFVLTAFTGIAFSGCGTVALPPSVELTLNGVPAQAGDYKPKQIQSLVLANGLLSITFGVDANGDFSAISVMKNGRELAHNLHGVEPRDVDARRTFYLDTNAGRGHLEADIVRVVKNTPELAHIAVIDNRALHLEHHFVMLKGESGVHPYVIVKSGANANSGETRTMYRFDMDILDGTWTNERTGKQPKYAFLQSISEAGNMGDETWRLPDGSVYQKYDYSLYFANSPMWGHYGHGFGVFFMPVSTESYAGGPLRHELAVHQDALILNYIGGGHFGGGGSATGRNGEKIHGPWFLYFNTGDTPEAIIADAKKVAAEQKKQWPYRWMEDPLYPVERTTVTGQLKLSHDRPAAGAYVILGQPNNPARGGGGGGRGGPPGAGAAAGRGAPAPGAAGAPPAGRGGRGGGPGGPTGVPDRASVVYTQSGDYIYYAHADANGKFSLTGVRPGSYTLYAWQTQGPVTQSLAKDDVEVKGETLDLGAIEWDAPYHPNLLFQVGNPDRMAGEFKFGSEPRSNQWVRQIPSDLTFTVGRSKISEDWYYAQHSGTWTIKFNVARVPSGNAHLTIPIAGGPGNVTVLVNDHEVGKIAKGDDASVRRAANRSGVYARFEFTFPASVLKAGENVVSLQMPARPARNGAPADDPAGQTPGTAANNGLMYDAIVLESD
ncbi:MAG: polysaccharide lyase family protein [Opitutaceae bacterium]